MKRYECEGCESSCVLEDRGPSSELTDNDPPVFCPWMNWEGETTPWKEVKPEPQQ